MPSDERRYTQTFSLRPEDGEILITKEQFESAFFASIQDYSLEPTDIAGFRVYRFLAHQTLVEYHIMQSQGQAYPSAIKVVAGTEAEVRRKSEELRLLCDAASVVKL